MREILYVSLLLLLGVSSVLAGERYAINFNDGTVGVMDLVQGTAEEAVAKWAPSEKARVVSITKVNEADLPTDRTFRNAWTFDKAQKKFGTDMVKAKQIWTEKLLRDRSDKINKAKKDLEDAKGLGKSQAVIKAAQDAATAAEAPIPVDEINAATTPAELKAITLP